MSYEYKTHKDKDGRRTTYLTGKSAKNSAIGKKLKEGFHKDNLPKAKKIEGGGSGFSYKDLKK